jgi:hypothetical protein
MEDQSIRILPSRYHHPQLSEHLTNTSSLMNVCEEALLVVEREYSGIPDGLELYGKIKHKFLSFFENPRADEFENVLKRKISYAEAQVIIFQPSSTHRRYFF